MNVTFTLAEENMLPDIVATYNASIPGRLATADTEPVSIESKLDWFREHQKPERPLWIIHYHHTYAGWLSFSNFYGRPAYSETAEVSIYLQPEFQKMGLGKKALTFALQQAQGCKIKTLLGFIFGHNEASLKLFYSFGFEKYALLPQVAVLDGIARDLIIVGKRV
jgi:phosphinothricin acetyltransferase